MTVFGPPDVLGVNAAPADGVAVAFTSLNAGAGTISVSAGSGAVTGVGTAFLAEFLIGDSITAGGETRVVREISSDTAMVTSPFTNAHSGVAYTLTGSPALRWQFTNSGMLFGGAATIDPEAPRYVLNVPNAAVIDNGSLQASTGTARFQALREYTGSGNTNTYAIAAHTVISQTTTAPGPVSGAGLAATLSIGFTNNQSWGGTVPGFAPAGVRAALSGHTSASGTIPALCGVLSIADAGGSTGPSSVSVTKMFGYALTRVSADSLTTGIGAGLYNVGGTNKAYLALSASTFAVPTGSWAIWDDTGLDSRLSGALKIGSDLVIDANAILHQYGVALPKNNNTASTAPTANDDSTADYSVGSVWFWPATGRIWKLRDATASAAEWVEIALADEQGYISGNWYIAPDITVAEGTPPSADAIQMVPLTIKTRVTLASLGVRITTAEHAGNLELALYANDPATGRPTGNAVATTASISTASTGPVSAAIVGGNVTLEPGLYWACFNLDNVAGDMVAVQVPSPANHPTASLVGSSSQANLGASGSDDLVSLHVAQSFGTWPDLTSATFVEGSTPSRNGPAMHFEVA